MFLGRITLSTLAYVAWTVATTSGVGREKPAFLFGQSAISDAPFTTFDWWPFDNLETSIIPSPSLVSSDLSSLPAIITSSASSSSHTPPSPSPSIVDITALPPATTNAPHPRIRTKDNLKPFSLAPLFAFAGLLFGALVGWFVFSSYNRWVARSDPVTIIPGPPYVPVRGADERAGSDRRQLLDDVEGSPSKHTRHGAKYSSYSVGRGLLGRIPSSRFYKPLPSMTQERTKPGSSEKSFTWPSLPDPPLFTPPHSRTTTNTSTKSTQIPATIPDDPFAAVESNSTGTDKIPQTVVVASRTSTRSTFARTSRFSEMWSDDEGDQGTVVASSFNMTNSTEGDSEVRTGLLKKIRSKSRSAKGKKRGEESANSAVEPASPVKETSWRKGSWKFPWIPGSPSVKRDSFTTVPARTSSPRSQSFKTPESSPRKPSYARSGEGFRLVDTSVLPASPPTLTSPRWESELFLNPRAAGVPGTPTPKRKMTSRVMNGARRDEEWNDLDILVADSASLSSPLLGESEHSNENHDLPTHDSRPEPGRRLSTASISTISEFPGRPPPRRTPAERFHARQSALDRVDEIIQRSRSQTSVANVAVNPGKPTSDGVEIRRFGRGGKKFGNDGIEQRLLES